MKLARAGLLAGAATLAAPIGLAPSATALAVGADDADIDRDGRADVIVGAWGEPQGAVYVYFGDGTTQRIGGEQIEGRVRAVGFSLDTCDVNGDGFDDVVAGDPAFADGSLGQYPGAGAVVVLYGSPNGLARWNFVSQNSPGVPEVSEVDDGLGWSVACGKTDVDRFDDVVAGVPFESFANLGESAGSVMLFRGWSTGLVPSAARIIHQNAPGVPDQIENPPGGENFGWAVELADVTGDAYAETLIGIPGESDGLGALQTMRGTPTGWGTSANGIVHGGTTVGAVGLGLSITSGNLNGTGPRDVAVGSWFCSIADQLGCVDYSGAVTFLPGSASGLAATRARTLGRPQGRSLEEGFGAAIAAGDVTGDGVDELLVGTPGRGEGGMEATGEVWLFRGTASGPTVVGATRFNQNSPGVPDGIEAGDEFGSSVALADRTGDGRAEAVIGAPSDDYYGTYEDSGVVSILRGTATGLTGTGSVTVKASDWGGTLSSSQRFGFAVAG
jgi:hypothetical protein